MAKGDRKRRLRASGERLKDLSFTKLIPNILTVLALCAGMTAIRFALLERWEAAVAAIIIAGMLDAFDGRVARLLGGGTRFGAELDSLSDVVSFGVAPAVILHVWVMNSAGGIGWALVLLYCVCCGLRLARFNTQLESDRPPPWAYNFFVGVPAPAAAGIVLLPMMLTFYLGRGIFDHVALNSLVVIGVSALMVSRLPTPSFKSVRVAPNFVLLVLLLVGLLAAFLVVAPWKTISAIAVMYLLSFPFSFVAFRRRAREAAKQRGASDHPPEEPVD